MVDWFRLNTFTLSKEAEACCSGLVSDNGLQWSQTHSILKHKLNISLPI